MLLISSSKCDMFYDVPWFYIHISFLLFLENKNKKKNKTANMEKKMWSAVIMDLPEILVILCQKLYPKPKQNKIKQTKNHI